MVVGVDEELSVDVFLTVEHDGALLDVMKMQCDDSQLGIRCSIQTEREFVD